MKTINLKDFYNGVVKLKQPLIAYDNITTRKITKEEENLKTITREYRDSLNGCTIYDVETYETYDSVCQVQNQESFLFDYKTNTIKFNVHGSLWCKIPMERIYGKITPSVMYDLEMKLYHFWCNEKTYKTYKQLNFIDRVMLMDSLKLVKRII